MPPRSQPTKAPNSRALYVKCLHGCLVAIIRHVVNRLNPSGETAKLGAPGQEFAESANAEASNFMRTGVGYH